MQLDGGRDGKQVLVGEEPARRDERRLRGRQICAILPCVERRVDPVRIEARDRRPQLGPGIGAAHRKPVPRGANSHLCVPLAKKSAPSRATSTSWFPKPCTPSTISRQRSAHARPRLARATTSAMRAMGSFTPLDECTQVTPTARALAVIARPMRSTIWSALARAPLSYNGMYRTLALERAAE